MGGSEEGWEEVGAAAAPSSFPSLQECLPQLLRQLNAPNNHVGGCECEALVVPEQ